MAHALFRETLSPVDQLSLKITAVEKEKKEAEFRALLAAGQLADYQQQVATLLPDAIKGKSDQAAYPLRQLASVIGGGTKGITIERASGLLEQAKGAFREKDFEQANHLLTRLIDRYPESLHVAEAHFLLAEGQYRLKEYDSSVATIEKMVDLFPENELTGFALLRLGSVFEKQDRLEDASDIYQAVLGNFKQTDLVHQAQASLKAVKL